MENDFKNVLKIYTDLAFKNDVKFIDDLTHYSSHICDLDKFHMSSSNVRATLIINDVCDDGAVDVFIETDKFIDWCNNLND